MSENRTITVTGRGDIHVVPDVTRLEVTVFNVLLLNNPTDHQTYSHYETSHIDTRHDGSGTGRRG